MEKITNQLQEKIGENLLSVYIYTPNEKETLLLILKKSSFSDLEQVKNILKKTSVIILTEKDLKNGADVFAVEFLRFKYHTQLKSGVDVLKNITIDKKHLRQHLEYEMRNKLIYLRLEFLKQSNLKRFYPFILPVFNGFLEALLFLKDQKKIGGMDLSEKINLASDLYQIDLEVFALLKDPNAKEMKQKVADSGGNHIIQMVNDSFEALILKVNNL